MKPVYSILFLSFIISISKCQWSTVDFKFKVIDFQSSQPGFNLDGQYWISQNLDIHGLVTDTLGANSKPQFNITSNKYINKVDFDNSFVEATGVTKSVILTKSLTYFNNNGHYVGIESDSRYLPINQQGWNEGVAGDNNYFCIEGHYEFKYISQSNAELQVHLGDEYFSYVNGKLAIEHSGVKFPFSLQVADLNTGFDLVVGQYYPLDIFACQRFNPYVDHYFYLLNIPFEIKCRNIPGVNDDVCPPPPCSAATCDDHNSCTNDVCIQDECIHTPIVCDNGVNGLCGSSQCVNNTGCVYTPPVCQTPSDKCVLSKGCNPSTGLCESEAKICQDSIACTHDSCDSTTGSCSFFANNTQCDDHNKCTNDQCSYTGGCTNTPVDCGNNPNDKCTSKACNALNGECVTTTVSCPPVKLIDLLGLGLICCQQKCNAATGGCTPDRSAPLLSLLLCV